MKNQWFACVHAVVLLAVIGAPSFAGELAAGISFTSQEKSIIQDYFRKNALGFQTDNGDKSGGKGKPPRSLPPGIAKNLERGKPLPSGIAKRVLPAGLVERLPRPPKGFERIIVDGKVLLVDVATQIIHDKLEDMILR